MPQYASQITASAKQSFLQGDQWAHLAGIIAVLIGAALVFFMFPRRQPEQEMLARFAKEDAVEPSPALAHSAENPQAQGP